MGFYEEIKGKLLLQTEFKVLWDWLQQSEFGIFLQEMRETPQNPKFHGEGDVYTHTRLVCAELVRLNRFCMLGIEEQTELFLAALLHDIGKLQTTVLEEGKWISPHHSSVGSRMARTFLWKTCGLCGTKEKMRIREVICGLVRYHMLPVHMIDQEDAQLRIRQVAALGEQAEGFSWHKLCMLAQADIRGRVASDIPECEEKVELCRLLASEAGCLEQSFLYQSDYVKHAYLTGRNVMPDQLLYDDTWGAVMMVAGLPGTGKDTWISQNLAQLPMVSLDDIRRELKIKPTDDQGAVIQEARERAKKYLRIKQPFVWNATNLTIDIRQKQIRLFEQYGASVKIIYLETDESIRKNRNISRESAVPEEVVEKLLRKTELPAAWEAQTVKWLCV